MLGLIAAEKEEVGGLIKTLKAKIIEFNGIRYYIGSLDDRQVILCFSGVGKANAAAVAMNMIVNFGVDKIFNIGFCGSCKSNIVPGTILIANACQYDDVDLTPLDYLLNQIPDELTEFAIKDKYVNQLKTMFKDAVVGTIATGDTFITLKNIEMFPALASKDIVSFDMEACAIAQICQKTRTDFFCLKVVSDNIFHDADSKKKYRTNLKDLAKQAEEIAFKVLDYFSK